MAARPSLKTFAENQAGATAIEYGLIVSLIFLVIVGAVSSFSHNTATVINTAANAIGGAM